MNCKPDDTEALAKMDNILQTRFWNLQIASSQYGLPFGCILIETSPHAITGANVEQSPCHYMTL